MGITSDIERAEAQIRNIVINQIPFGVSKGVNDSLTEVRNNHIWGAYNQAFEARSYNFFKHTHAIFRSDKEQAKRTGLISAIFRRVAYRSRQVLAGQEKSACQS